MPAVLFDDVNGFVDLTIATRNESTGAAGTAVSGRGIFSSFSFDYDSSVKAPRKRVFTEAGGGTRKPEIDDTGLTIVADGFQSKNLTISQPGSLQFVSPGVPRRQPIDVVLVAHNPDPTGAGSTGLCTITQPVRCVGDRGRVDTRDPSVRQIVLVGHGDPTVSWDITDV